MAKRDPNDFLPKTIDEIARRAAYHCSLCKTAAYGPKPGSDEGWVYVGQAAHIHGARNGSQRWIATMTEVERSEAKNGIFVCSNCHLIIDPKNGGPGKYSGEELKQLKVKHEVWAEINRDRLFSEGVLLIEGLHEAFGEDEAIGFESVNEPVHLGPNFHSRAIARRAVGTRLVRSFPGTTNVELTMGMVNGRPGSINYASAQRGGYCPVCNRTIGMQVVVGVESAPSPNQGCPGCGRL